jgi:hypothetical protein
MVNAMITARRTKRIEVVVVMPPLVAVIGVPLVPLGSTVIGEV